MTNAPLHGTYLTLLLKNHALHVHVGCAYFQN